MVNIRISESRYSPGIIKDLSVFHAIFVQKLLIVFAIVSNQAGDLI